MGQQMAGMRTQPAQQHQEAIPLRLRHKCHHGSIRLPILHRRQRRLTFVIEEMSEGGCVLGFHQGKDRYV